MITFTNKNNQLFIEYIDKLIKNNWMEFQLKFFTLAENTGKEMKKYIKRRSRRTEGKTLNKKGLANSIKVYKETRPGENWIGIGKIDELPVYWYVTNYGKKITGEDYVPPFTLGSFNGNPPGQGTNRNEFLQKGKFLIRPVRAIRPLNYIEYGIDYFMTRITKYISKLGK